MEEHISDRELLKAADGELSQRQTAQVTEHLAACWVCRTRMHDLELAIEDFIHVHNDELNPLIPALHGPRALLRALLAEQVQQANSSIWHRLFAKTQWRVRPLQSLGIAVATVVVCFCTAFGIAVLRSPKPVTYSASVLLRQSGASEQAMLAKPGRVVHRVISLEQRAGSRQQVVSCRRIETWQSTGKNLKARRMYNEQGRLVGGEWLKTDGGHIVYRDARLRPVNSEMESRLTPDFIWELSPSAEDFASITQNPDNLQVEALPTVYVLKYHNSQSRGRQRLINASLTLRRTDMHAIEQTLEVEQDGETRWYRFVENALEQRPEMEVAANVFNIDHELTGPPSAVAKAAPPEPIYVPAPAELLMEALERLDRVDALLKDQVKVEHTPQGALLIQGIFGTDERKQEVLRALGSLVRSPAVKIVVNTAAEAQEKQLNTQAGPLKIQSVEVAVGSAPGNPELRKSLATAKDLSVPELNEEIQRLSNSVVKHFTQAQLHTMVLKGVVESFSAAELDSLRPGVRSQWRAIVTRHGKAVEHELGIVRQELLPVVGSAPVSKPGRVTVGGDLRAATTRLYEITASVDQSIWAAMALSPEGTSTTPLKTAQILESLGDAENLAAGIAERASR